MREIKFRVWNSKKRILGKWYSLIEYLVSTNNSSWLDFDKVYLQYTWLHDSYWKEIYEWDIVRILYTDWKSPEFAIETLKNLPLDEYKKKISRIWVVTFYADKYAEWWLDMKWYSESIYEWKYWEKEVIGNIYENPEIYANI